MLMKKFAKNIFRNNFKFATVDPFGGQNLKHPPINSKRLEGKVAVITGGSQGVGQSTAILFAKSGIDGVVIGDVNAEGAQKTLDIISDITKDKKKAIFVKTDMRNQNQIENLMSTAMENYGKLNILVNNAGIMHSEDGGIETAENIWDLTMDINLKGVFFCCKYGIPHLLKSGGGSIINLSSIVALRGSATSQIAYTASKGGVNSLTKELACVYGKQNIRINNLCPGPLRTKLLMDFLDTKEKIERRTVHLPMGRFGESIEIAQAIAFLASDESSFITGSEFSVDGGLLSSYVTPE